MSKKESMADEMNQIINQFTKRLYNTLSNFIIVVAIASIILLFLSADKGEAYAFTAPFLFMSELTNPCSQKKRGGAVSEAIKDLTETAGSFKNVGKAIDNLTSDVKTDVDTAKYFIETFSIFKSVYCGKNHIDDIGIFNSFLFVLFSSGLVCYNSIQMLNTFMVKGFNAELVEPYYLGILGGFVILMLFIKATQSIVTTTIQHRFNISNTKSKSYANNIAFSSFSALISIFLLYILISIVSYIVYLPYGLINIQSEQSALKIQFAYLVFLMMIPTLIGFNVMSENFELPSASPQIPCNNSSATLNTLMIVFIVPIVAAIYCISQLIFRGIMGVSEMFDFKDYVHMGRLKMIFGYSLLLFVFYTLYPLVVYFSIPTIIKMVGNADLLKTYYSFVN